jgi:uncharacterized membrane protein
MSAATKTVEQLNIERLVFFTDAVFAIAITLLVLEIKVPDLHGIGESDANLRAALFAQLPKMIGFAISFVVINAFWQGHHRMFRYVTHFSSSLLILNSYFLLFICFLPFPTGVFSEHPNLHTSFLLYGSTLAIAGLLQWNLWCHAASTKLLNPQMDPVAVKWIGRRTLVVPGAALLAVALSFWSLPFAGMAFGTIPLWVAIVNRFARKAGVPS